MTAPLPDGGANAARDGGAVRPVYFGPTERRLFGWYHPAREGIARDVAIVLCGTLGEESTGVHRAFRHWAERLAAAGIATLRFDYDGTGDSAGQDSDPGRVGAWIGSVGGAIDFVRATSGAANVALAGIRVGATFALASAVDRGDVDALILWAPFPTGRAYLREGRAFTRLMAPAVASTMDSAGGEQLGGLVLSAETVVDLNALDPLEGGRTIAVPVLLIPRDEGSADSAFVQRLTRAGMTVERRVIDAYTDVMVDAHQSVVPERLIDGTVTWLGSRYEPLPQTSRPSVGLTADQPRVVIPGASWVGRDDAATAESVVETPTYFGENRRLFGILSRPSADRRRRTGIVLANSGAVYRAGPNRWYVSLAREWAALGYSVLRMDIGGLGDSGAPPGAVENHTYPDHAVRDVASGIALLREQGVERVVVAGLCSGAHTSFHAGLELDRIDGLMVVNPIVFYWKPSDPLDVASWVNYNDVRHYRQSLRQRESWMRLLRGRVNILHLARVAATRLKAVVGAKGSSVRRRFRGDTHQTENVALDLQRIAAHADVLLLFSDGDPGLDALTLNYERELRRLERDPAFQLRIVPDADHTFTALDARRRAQAALTEHLLARHS